MGSTLVQGIPEAPGEHPDMRLLEDAVMVAGNGSDHHTPGRQLTQARATPRDLPEPPRPHAQHRHPARIGARLIAAPGAVAHLQPSPEMVSKTLHVEHLFQSNCL